MKKIRKIFFILIYGDDCVDEDTTITEFLIECIKDVWFIDPELVLILILSSTGVVAISFWLLWDAVKSLF